MSLPTSRASYADYYRIWDVAIADPSGIRIRVDSYDAAINHRMWLHKARTIYKDESRELHPLGDPRHNISPYDHYKILIRPAPGDADDFYLLVCPRTTGILGAIESLTGTELEPQWTHALEHEPRPQLTSPSGTRPLLTKSDSSSDAPSDRSSSPDSTTPERNPAMNVSRRL